MVYLVFETALLSLFCSCMHCFHPAKVVTGSLLCIIQACTNCDKNRTWESQPDIGNIPAGNILTFAAILYSGAYPATALKMFNILNVATISQKTFFRHQTQYLQPSVDIVWKCSQELLLKSLKHNGDPLPWS